MKISKKWILSSCLGLAVIGSNAQLTLSGEVRPRAEYRNGYKTLMDSSQTNAFFIDQRTRLNIDYKNEDFDVYVCFQDYRIWGNTAQLNTADGFLALHEAWGKAKLKNNWALKFGRQEIKYDDDRILGNVEWAQQARSHDAVLLQYKNEKSIFDLGIAFNQSTAGLTGTFYSGPANYRDMYYGYFHHKLSENLQFSLLSMTLGIQADRTDGNGNPYKIFNYNSTLGTHVDFSKEKIKIGFNGFYQLGSDVNTYTNNQGRTYSKGVSAYLVGIDAEYKVNDKFSVTLGYETQSGTSKADTTDAYNEVNRSFNPWFGTNHKFNGYMDFFYVGSGHGGVGLQNAYLKFGMKKENWSLSLDAHMFMMGFGAEVLDNDSYSSEFTKLVDAGNLQAATDLDPYTFKYKPYLGTEIDLTLTAKLNKSVKLVAGYSYLMGSTTLYNLKGVTYYNMANNGNLVERDLPMNHWGYIMIVFKPKFLEK